MCVFLHDSAIPQAECASLLCNLLELRHHELVWAVQMRAALGCWHSGAAPSSLLNAARLPPKTPSPRKSKMKLLWKEYCAKHARIGELLLLLLQLGLRFLTR